MNFGRMLLFAWLLSMEAAGDGPAPVEAPAPSTITSHQRNFMVTAMPRSEALALALWAEDVRERVLTWSDLPAPAGSVFPLVMAAEIRRDDPRGYVMKAQDRSPENYLRQELTIVNPARTGREDVLEVLTGLLLNRWLVERTGRPDAQVPDWLAVGVAQNVYPEWQAGHLDVLSRAGALGLDMSAAGVFRQHIMPAGRWPEKAHAGLVMAWLAASAGADRILNRMMDVLAVSSRVTMADMMDLVGVDSVRACEMHWETWLAAQSRKLVPGRWTRDASAIERIVAMNPADFGLIRPSHAGDERLDIETLIEARQEPWAREAAQVLRMQLGEAMIGKSPELVQVARNYMLFFDALAGDDGQRSPAPARRLRRMWEEAGHALDGYRESEAARRYFVDAAQMPVTDVVAPDPEAVKKWLDRWDQP